MTAHQHRRIGPGAARGMLGGRAALATSAAAMLAGSIVLGLRGPVVAAPPNQLLNPAVTPVGGTTNTTFAFSVTFQSAQGNAPTSVTAVAGNVVIPLRLVSGAPDDGRYRGTAKLPAGAWDVSFQASAKGNDPNLAGPSVTVDPTPLPSPTPRPTPRPTPKPTPRATAVPTRRATPPPTIAPPPTTAPQTTVPRTPRPAPARPSQRPRPTPRATATARQTALVGGGVRTPSPTPAASAGSSVDGPSGLVTVLTGSLVAIAVLALASMSILLAARRRRRRDTRLELLPEEARHLPAGGSGPAKAAGPRQATAWERDWALDEAPIGSVEYRPTANGAAPKEEGA